MSGIGVTLKKFFNRHNVASNIIGMGYSAMVTVAPMFVVIGCILLMQAVLGYEAVGYAQRNLFACTVLYIFIFSLLTASPFNAVLSRYMSDVIYEERPEDILPCYYVGLLLNIILSTMVAIPFCIWEHVVGEVPIHFVFTGYCGYVCLVMVFYSMLYLSIAKDYKEISFFFLLGMVVAFLFSWIFVKGLHMEITYSMLLGLAIGFFLTATMEMASVIYYFKENSGRYKPVLSYFRIYWQLIVINFMYTAGLYVHNFVFWTTDLRIVVAKSFISAPSYDMATCIAMFTNISMTVIFISQVEMHFRDRYKAYSESVIGGRGMDVEKNKKMMFSTLADQVMSLVRIQFIISVVIYLVCVVVLPRMGFAGTVMEIYPCLAAGYFILFIMYSLIIFHYYFNDLTGGVLTATAFFAATILGAIFSSHLAMNWYGLGLVIGTIVGWTSAFMRLRWTERNMDAHIFCRGDLYPRRKGVRPSDTVYSAYDVLRSPKKLATADVED
ncbi:hypothetical protein FACS1894111_06740 [Clostridia bacterium]|nr:hypothetical protein FACS1894111_06740 [Clostridia bacterium]